MLRSGWTVDVPYIKIGDQNIPIPAETVSFLESRLGDRSMAAAALRGAIEPAYLRQMQAAVQSGKLPQAALDLASQMQQQKPKTPTRSPLGASVPAPIRRLFGE